MGEEEKRKKKVVIDTNVFISAFGWGGVPDVIVKMVVKQEVLLYTSSIVSVISYQPQPI